MLGQKGFTLTNILVTVSLIAGGFAAWKINASRQERKAMKRTLEASAAKLSEQVQAQLKNDFAWQNTIRGRENKPLACLTEQTSCAGKAGLIAVRDIAGLVVVDSIPARNGFTAQGAACTEFSENGNDDCPFRMEVRWEPRCKEDCVKPPMVVIRGILFFRPGAELKMDLKDTQFTVQRDSEPAEARSCLEVLSRGQTSNGIYAIRPDPSLPAFSVHCDQTLDGGGWALVVNSSKTELGSLPTEQTVGPFSNARLPSEKINALLSASEHQSNNNLRVVLPDIDGGLTLGASSNGGTEAITFKATMPEGECRKVNETPSFASKEGTPHFSLQFSGKGLAGFVDKMDTALGYIGFYSCFGASFNGEPCSAGCGRSWKGSLVRLRGSLWIR